MGLQDRDYYREKLREINQEDIYHTPNLSRKSKNSPNALGKTNRGSSKKSDENGISIKYLAYPIFMLAALWYGSNFLLDIIKSGKKIAPESLKKILASPSSAENTLIPGGITLQADQNGHFRGIVLINNIRMPFLIDTGATQTTIPSNLAIAAGLPFGKPISKITAGGQVIDQMTRLNSLKLGNAELTNIEGSINHHIDEVLIGMNTLKHFQIQQNGNTLTLATYNHTGAIESTIVQVTKALENTKEEMPLRSFKQSKLDKQAKITWQKITTCDEQKNCRTTYKDH
jgi:aspartyl protease family protein